MRVGIGGNGMNSESFETIILSRVPHPIDDRLSIKFPFRLFPSHGTPRSLCVITIFVPLNFVKTIRTSIRRYREGEEKIRDNAR